MSKEQPRVVTFDTPDRPAYVVWELTLKCDLACRHCGSRAGKARPKELSLEQALEVVQQLADMGTEEVTFIGGEAYLYPEWLKIVEATAAAGIRCGMTTGARALTPSMARQAKAAGIHNMSVSIDGLEATHDKLRAVAGSWQSCLAAFGHMRDAGIVPFANTQFNRLNLPEIEDLAAILFEQKIGMWQVQITGPMGRAADQADWLLQPYDMLEFIPRLAAVAGEAESHGCVVHAANNLGYFGPHEQQLRRGHWQGCTAGRYTLGIEADGSVKGCPSLPTAPYVGGNITETPLAEIWEKSAELRFVRERTVEELWGFCKGCYYADVCRGGCSWTAHTLLGRRGNMPYCHHRAIEQKAAGIRERLVHVEDAPGLPFDFGRFDLVTEPWTD
jgi:radical SAM protein with 4Fe4S-binding SPASM domain